MISYPEIILQLSLAASLSSLVGLERERKNWFAGLRTHMLVCMGSTLLMIVSQHGFESVLQPQLVVLDPSRVAAQVVSGIGFLGAGTIIFWKNMIRGLTTAASLWAVAALGLAIGGRLYFASVFATILVLLILAAVKPIENFFFKTQRSIDIKFSAKPPFPLARLDEVLLRLQLRPYLTDLRVESEGDMETVELLLYLAPSFDPLKFAEEIKLIGPIEKLEIL